jgi:hypothetical protein
MSGESALFWKFIIAVQFFFNFVLWDGMELSPLGTSATVWPIVPVPNDRL